MGETKNKSERLVVRFVANGKVYRKLKLARQSTNYKSTELNVASRLCAITITRLLLHELR